MGASFEESVIALKSMFPDVSEVVVRTTLEARDGHGERGGEIARDVASRGRWTRWERLRTVWTRRAGGDGDVAGRVRRAKRVRAVITLCVGAKTASSGTRVRARATRARMRGRVMSMRTFSSRRKRAASRTRARREARGRGRTLGGIVSARPSGTWELGVGEEETDERRGVFSSRA